MLNPSARVACTLAAAMALCAWSAPAHTQPASQPTSQPAGQATDQPTGQPAIAPTTQPVRLFEAAGRPVLLAGDGTVSFGGSALTVEGQPVRRAVGAVEMGGHLLVAVRDGAMLVFELPGGGDGGGDGGGGPRLVQVLDGLGRDLVSMGVDRRLGRVLVLASGTAEVFGVLLHPEDAWRQGDPTRRAYVDHARFLDMLGEAGDGRDAAGQKPAPRTMAVGPATLLLATDGGLFELLHANRGYAVLARAALPEGVARVESLAFVPLAGRTLREFDADAQGEPPLDESGLPRGRWLLAGLDHQAECVLLVAEHPGGPWTDLGVGVLDAALASSGRGEGDDAGNAAPIAWLPGAFTVDGGVATLCIRGERGAAASWPAHAATLEADALTIRWLDGGGAGGGGGGGDAAAGAR